MIQHRDHNYTEAATLIEPSRILLEESRDECIQLAAELQMVSSRVQGVMTELNYDTNKCALDIENTFSALRTALAIREKSLLSRLKNIADRKKSALNEQLDKLRGLSDKCNDLADCADAIIEAGCRLEDENGGIYMVNTAHVVRRRANGLKKEYGDVSKQPVAEPNITCRMNSESKDAMHSILKTFGWLGTSDNTPAEAKIDSLIPDPKSDKCLPGELDVKMTNTGAADKETELHGVIRIPLAISLALKSGYVH